MGRPPVTPSASVRCTHCGDPCASDTIVREEATFCCSGCATVYAILKDNNLLDFYQIDEQAGARADKSQDREYDWLDVPKLAESFVRYRDENRCHVALELPGIHCSSCIWLLERLPQLLPGVRSCTIDYSRKVATIVYDPRELSLRKVAEMLDRIGYPPHFRSQAENATPVTNNRKLVYRIGVAGFCFGNIMLLSFPEYFGMGAVAGDATANPGAAAGAEWVRRAMNYLLLFLSLPVTFYAGKSFFTGAWYGLRARRVTIDLPIAIGMAALFLRSVVEILAGTGSGYLDSLAGLVFFLLIGRWFQSYTFARLNFERDYKDYFPVAAYREEPDGTPLPVASEDVKTGDVLLIRPGHLIPADGSLAGTNTGRIDYSFVTGEAEPQTVAGGQEVYAGGRATTSALRVRVSKPADQSYLLQLWLREGQDDKQLAVAPPELLIRMFTVVILLLAAVTFGYWYGKDVALAYRSATAVLIIACPCALALAAPFCYGSLQRLLAGTGFYLRGPAVIERLGKINAFVFDKTGTLTAGTGAEQPVFVMDRSPELEAVFIAMARRSGHPRSGAFVRALARDDGRLPDVDAGGTEEVIGSGLRLLHEGRVFLIGSPSFCGFEHYTEGTFAAVDGLLYCSLLPGQTTLRDGVGEMLGQVRESGPVWLLSGDHAPKDGFRWEDHLLPENIRFRQSPFDKLREIREMREAGTEVLMVGDGLNDAGALAVASVGLAVSEDEARFNPACDGIVRADHLAVLPGVLLAARRMKRVVIFTYLLAFTYNLIGLSYAVSGTLSPVVAAVLMPLSSISIVVVATLGAALVHRLVKPAVT